MTKNDLAIRIRRVLKFYYFGFSSFYAEFKQYLRYSKTVNQFKTETRFISTIVARYHVVEKGLTMPKTRLGFGAENVIHLLEDLIEYKRLGYDLHHPQFLHAVSVLKEYIDFHKLKKYDIDTKITILFAQFSDFIQELEQPSYNFETYFAQHDKSFDLFSASRHSLRNFSKVPVGEKELLDALIIAQNTPTPCNRQPNRVYVVKDKSHMKHILDIQGGNRGFGEYGDKLLIITSDISVFSGVDERNESYKNSGMFSMNLLYALHFKKIGACSLQWGESKIRNSKLRELIAIPDNEIVMMMILIGMPEQEFSVASSCRNPINYFVEFI